MYAAVDLGSNSFRLHVGKHDGDTIRVIKSVRDPIRLVAGLDANGDLTEAASSTAARATILAASWNGSRWTSSR